MNRVSNAWRIVVVLVAVVSVLAVVGYVLAVAGPAEQRSARGGSTMLSAQSIVAGSTDSAASLAAGQLMDWYWTPPSTPSLLTVVCAAYGTGVSLGVSYGGWFTTPAITHQYGNLYVGMFYLNSPPSGTQDVAVGVSGASGTIQLECSATAWTGTIGVDTTISNTNYEQGSQQTYVTIAPKATVPANEVFFSALSKWEWGAGTQVSVAGTGATAVIVDSNTNKGSAPGDGCQQAGSSDVDCIASAALNPYGTSLKYTWLYYGAYAAVAGFGIVLSNACYPSYVTVTAHIYQGKGQIYLGGYYLSNGASHQYAAGCGESYSLSVYNPSAGYSFFQWTSDWGAIANTLASSTSYEPDPSFGLAATISLVLSISAVSASSSDWNYYNSYLGTGWFAAGYQVGNPTPDQTGTYWAKGYVKLPDSSHFAYAPGPCEDPSGAKCYDEILFGVGLGYPPWNWAFGGVDMQIAYATNKVTLTVIWHTPTEESHNPYLGNLGDNVSISVGYQPSTGTDYIYVCAASCQDASLTGAPDLSRAFEFATMNIYAPNGVITAPPAMWIQVPAITQPVMFGPVNSFLSPSDRVYCVFQQAGYGTTYMTPGYSSTAFGASAFAMTFSYG